MRILLIEDDPTLNALLKEYLHDACYAVDSASDGDEGLFLAQTNEYDLIITDHLLPKRSGLELTKALRADCCRCPIIMVTCVGDQKLKLDAFEAGISDFLSKPFLLEEFLARIRCRLTTPALSGPAIYRLGSISIDTASCSVTKNGKEVYLTNKEYCLLDFFLRHQGKIVSRGLIMEHVWDAKADPFSNTVETHILRLRRKLGSGRRRQDLIQTIPNRGYRFKPLAMPLLSKAI